MGDMVLLINGGKTENDIKIKFVTLPHPKFQTPVVYVIHGDNFMELQTSQFRKFNTWFINQKVISNNNLTLATKFDPKFLLLPFLEKYSSKFSPLDQILTDVEGCSRIPLSNFKNWQLDLCCDIKDLGDDLILFRYNADKTLNWLNSKVIAITNMIAKNVYEKSKVNSGAIANSFNIRLQASETKASEQICNDELIKPSKEDKITALQIITEYLNESMTNMLLKSSEITLSELNASLKPQEVKRKADWQEELEIEKETLAFTTSVGNKVIQDNKPNEMSLKTTQNIAQASKKVKSINSKPLVGVKSISSFFTKK